MIVKTNQMYMKTKLLFCLFVISSLTTAVAQICTAFPVPFHEGFNSDSTSESCWTVINANSDADSWDMNYATNPFEGNQAAMLFTDFNAGNNNDWLISPTILVSGNERLKFRYRVQNANEPNDFRVMLSTSGSNVSDFTITLLPLASYNNSTYIETTIDLSSFTGPVNIAWHVPPGGLDGWRLFIDDVNVETIPSCTEPSLLVASNQTDTSVTLSWQNSVANSYEIVAFPCGSPAPDANTTGFITSTTNPTVVTGLTPNTCYDFYIRANCGTNDLSIWSNRASSSTLITSPICGGQFYDNGGANGNYLNNSDTTTIICPSNSGELVTVTFSSFTTEPTWDGLYVFNGNSINAPQIMSGNGTGNGNLGQLSGAFWGTTIPGPFTSTSNDGCLTFRFRSDGSSNQSGWVAAVTCSLPSACAKPDTLVVSQVMTNSAQVTWNQPMNADTTVASNWEVLVVPCNSSTPTSNTVGIPSNATTFLMTNLASNVCYDVYVRAICNASSVSNWSSKSSFTTTCPIQQLPLRESFNSNSTTQNCWTIINGNGDADSWSMDYGLNTYEGDQCASINTDFNAGNNNDWLITPQMVLTGNERLRFRYRVQTATEPNDFRVMISTSGNNAADFTTTLVPLATYSNTTYAEMTVSLSGYTGPVFIGWHVPSGGLDGWRLYIDDVNVEQIPSCSEPTSLTVSNATLSSVNLSWTDTNTSNPSSWEVLVLPCGSAQPNENLTGVLASSNNSFLITGLQPSTCYTTYVRAICSSTNKSFWSLGTTFYTSISNDDCENAILLPVNNASSCSIVTPVLLAGATPSALPLSSTCQGVANDDVWFSFVATNATLAISFQSTIGGTTSINHAVYSGDCNNLTLLYCNTANQVWSTATNLIVGNTYYIRVYSTLNTLQNATFTLCISTPSTCSTAIPVCGINAYPNTTGNPSLGSIGCLVTTPNASFFVVKVAQTGAINLLITQTTNPNGTPNLDVDYAAWGPFDGQDSACNFVGNGQPFGAPGIGVPVSQQYGCSYSAAATETLNITNAIADQYYIVLVTNFSNQPGFITIVQSNLNTQGAGSIDCVGIRLNAFVDNNNNGIKDANDADFPLGQFHYEVNNNGMIHNIISPTGSYTIFDSNLSNSYDLSYTINNDYTSMYSINTNYSAINVASGGLTTYYFPVTINEDYTDLAVTLSPLNAPRAGTSYQNKITYTNNGTQVIALGTLQFIKNDLLTITNNGAIGGTPTGNGFIYNFTNLLPYESRSITVAMQVPTIPTVSIGQLLTNSAQVTPPTGDVVLNNNTASLTQAIIAAYDPNDKTESHGEEIVFDSFGQDDYLHYTIRFENTGNITALNVYLEDILDDQLDESSIIIESASHNYTLDRTNRNLYWTFKNIYLPVSVANTTIGKGYVTFKAKLKPGFAIGDIIPNTASIFFDTNPAIVTNTFNTEFVQVLNTSTFTQANVVIYPNPATSYVQVALNNSAENISTITLMDVLGKTILKQQQIGANQTIINTASLSKGIYLIKITSETNESVVKKMIIQ